MHPSRRWRRAARAPRTLDHAHMPVAHVVRFKSQRGCCQILSDDAHEKAMGALSKYRMAAPRRSTQRVASRTHASLPMTCGGYETAIGLGIEVWHAASRSRCERRRTDRAPGTRPPPRLQWIRHTEVRCGASLG